MGNIDTRQLPVWQSVIISWIKIGMWGWIQVMRGDR